MDGIESIPDVCGGEPCIAHTRIPVWVLEQARRQGAAEEAEAQPPSAASIPSKEITE